MSRKIKLDVLLNYNNLDTVIEELIKLRDEHGGNCTVDVETETEPYGQSEYATAHLIVPD